MGYPWDAMTLVRVRDPENMNVLGLLMAGFLDSALADERLAKRAAAMKGNVCIQAGRMWITLCFDGAGIEVTRGRTDKHRATVRGEMDALIGVVTGAGMVAPVLAGKIRIGGNPLFLLRMLPILSG